MGLRRCNDMATSKIVDLAEMLRETARGKDPFTTRAPYLSRSHDIHGGVEVTRKEALTELEGGDVYERIWLASAAMRR